MPSPGAPPRLSVVIPCRNEARHIGATLRSLAAQDVPTAFEVIVADGRSDDGTAAILDAFAREPLPFRLRVLANERRTIPAGLNLAVAAAEGDIVVRIDGHGELEPGYLRLMLDEIGQGGRDVAGPRIRMVPGGTGLVPIAIAAVLNSRLGNGGTASRNDLAEAKRVNHTVMSCYRREVWRAIGGYDEGLRSNEDFDFDYRARSAGFSVWSLPRPTYRLIARSTLGALARQRWRYGFWKAQVLKKHPRSLMLRQFVPLLGPPALVAAAWHPPLLAALAALGLGIGLVAFHPGVAARAGVRAWRYPGFLAGCLVATAIVQLVWAAGVMIGLAAPRRRRAADARAAAAPPAADAAAPRQEPSP